MGAYMSQIVRYEPPDDPHAKQSQRKRRNKIDQTTNILDLFMHCTGKSEVPPEWFLWSCLSVVAAAAADRVYFQKFPWEHIHPNLYVFLVGPSGAGKGQAINFAMQLRHSAMNLWYGEATHKGLKDKFSETRGEAPADGRPGPWVQYLVQTELADSVGTGTLADAFIKSMTNWYNPTKVDFQEVTRMHGEKGHPPPCLNWIAGTTPEWLRDCVSEQSMRSGFFGRVVGIPGDCNWNEPVYDPMEHQPPDYNEVMLYLCERMDAITMIPHGTPFTMSRHARQIDRDWYEGRTPPNDALKPFYRRMHDLALKLAMVLSLCRSQSLIIESSDITRAHELVTQARRDMPKIVEAAASDKFQLAAAAIMDMLRSRKSWVKRPTLARVASRYGLRSTDLDIVMRDLEDMDQVAMRAEKGVKMYRPNKRRRTVNLRAVAGSKPEPEPEPRRDDDPDDIPF